MNNNNNSKSLENNIANCDVDATVFIVNDANKIKDSEKRIKENQTGKPVFNKNKQKVFILGDSIIETVSLSSKNQIKRFSCNILVKGIVY